MGNCCTSGSPAITETVTYENSLTIKIKEKDGRGNVLSTDSVFTMLTSPSVQSFDKLQVDKISYSFSSCVIPGLDPRGLIKKECQDAVFYSLVENTILVGLFDGHGKEGQKIAHFCCRFMKKYFEDNNLEFVRDPQAAIENITVQCDASLRAKSSGIDAMLSGTTGLVMYINSEGFHAGGVGDSRAILSTLPPANTPIEHPPVSTNKYMRQIEPIRQLKSVPLTVDQKPNHELELARIESSGGKVQQLTDDYGNKVGPFRVWQQNGTLPGLAMSRSIGDGIAKEIGVIPNPICHFFPHIPFRDQFIVMCSDGVWDVMENIEVVNFTERFRKKCLQGIGAKEYPHGIYNSSISQLIAEEARYRWLGICEDEDVMIDDISVIVIEMGNLEPAPLILPPVQTSRKTIDMHVAVEVKSDREVKSGQLRGDLIRGSFLPAADPTAKKARFDPKRGSYANSGDKQGEEQEGHDDDETEIEGIPFAKEEAKGDKEKANLQQDLRGPAIGPV